MDNSESKFRISAPIDEQGVIIKLSITQESPGILQITHHPDYTFSGSIFVFTLFLTALFISLKSSYAFYSGLFLLASIYEIAVRRPIQCKIDTKAGTIEYKRGGFLGLRFNNQEISRSTSKLLRVEMKRHIQRWGDTFHIDLVLQGNESLPLSHGNLGFGECQEYAEKIKELLGLDISIKAVD